MSDIKQSHKDKIRMILFKTGMSTSTANAYANDIFEVIKYVLDENESQKAISELAVKALEWYAERKHWLPTVDYWPETDKDGGQLAISTLEEIKKREGAQ